MKKVFYFAMILAILLAGCKSTGAATKKTADAKKAVVAEKEYIVLEDTVFVGDKVLDVANMLGYMPKFASARFGQWPKSRSFETKKLGCPNRVTQKMKDVIPKLIDEQGVKKVVVEKAVKDGEHYCLLVKGVDPMDLTEILKGKDIELTIIDFSKSDREGIIQTAKYLGKEAEGKAIADKYEKDIALARKSMKNIAKDKKVVVLTGFLKKDTGRLFVYAEAEGFYTGEIFLKPFGAKNVSSVMNTKDSKIMKGSFPVTDLKTLIDANPDVIVLYGQAKEQIKEKLAKLAKEDAKFANIPAIKNNAIADNLPYYIGVDIEQGPSIINEWVKYFKTIK